MDTPTGYHRWSGGPTTRVLQLPCRTLAKCRIEHDTNSSSGRVESTPIMGIATVFGTLRRESGTNRGSSAFPRPGVRLQYSEHCGARSYARLSESSFGMGAAWLRERA